MGLNSSSDSNPAGHDLCNASLCCDGSILFGLSVKRVIQLSLIVHIRCEISLLVPFLP